VARELPRLQDRALYLPGPRIPEASARQLFDEWYILSSAAPRKNPKRFLNYEWLPWARRSVVYFRHNITWDVKRMRRASSGGKWQQMYPESLSRLWQPADVLTRNSTLLRFRAARPEFAGPIARQKRVGTIYSDSNKTHGQHSYGSTVRVSGHSTRRQEVISHRKPRA